MTKIEEIIQEFYNKLPKFPDGRIDYHTSDVAPVLTIFVEFDSRILLLKRSDKVRAYKGKWNVLAGYLDDLRPVQEKVLEELEEEIGVTQEEAKDICFGKVEKTQDKEIGMTWIGQPVLVRLKSKPKIKLDWEHVEKRWISPDNLEKYDFVFGLDKTLSKIRKDFRF